MHAYRLTYPWTVPRLMTMENTENAAPPTGPRTAAATAARMRQREEAAATLLVERGWKVETPDGKPWTAFLSERARLSAS